LQLDPDGVWYVPLRVPVIDPFAPTMALPDAASEAPPPIVSLNEKLGKLTVWPATVPETVRVPPPWAKSSTWIAGPVCVIVAMKRRVRVSDGKLAEQVDDAMMFAL
jgi:hypothetical protein